LLKEGYEASFLVLGANPIANFAAVERITLSVKQGHVFDPAKLSNEAANRATIKLSIRMVAGYREPAERKEVLVAGADLKLTAFEL